MTPFEQYFLDTMDYFEKKNVPIMIHASSLLRIIRENAVNPREGIWTDKELNITISDEDLTVDLVNQMAKDFPYFKPIGDENFNCFAIYYSDLKKDSNQSQWELKHITYITRFYKHKLGYIEYMGIGKCKLFPDKFYDKKNWSKVKFLGRTFNAPFGPEEYLDFYFGDWKTENKSWSWGKSTTMRDWKELKGGKI